MGKEYRHTEETKEKMRGPRPHVIPWNKGIKRPDISKLFKGKPKSEEHKLNISKTRRKKRLNGMFEKGNKIWLGKKHTTETREKMSRTAKKLNGKRPWIYGNKSQTGQKASDETRLKMRRAHLGMKKPWAKNNIGIARQAQQNMKGPTSIERKVYDELKRRGILFEKQKLINNKFVVDAYIPSLNLVIEADGDYWHSRPRTIGMDKSKNAYLTKCGYNLLRLSEKDINWDTEKEIDKINNFIN